MTTTQFSLSSASTELTALLYLSGYSFVADMHRFASWAAGRATSSKTCRFKVKIARDIIEEVGLPWLLVDKKDCPGPNEMTDFHRQLRVAVIAAAKQRGLAFSHGIAAKLINMYLKAALRYKLKHTDPLMAALHPPIDGDMLDALVLSGKGDTALWRRLKAARWTRFSSDDYEAAIAGLRELLGNDKPLWLAERFWGGYQGASRAK